MSRIVIIGATSGIAKACAREWASTGIHDFVLVGRTAEGPTAVGRDLLARSPKSQVIVLTCDFVDPKSIQKTVSKVTLGGAIDIALVAHGSMPTQAQSVDLAVASSSLVVNGVSPALFAEALTAAMLEAGKGTLAVIGSVAGDRGRKSNYTYGAAKSMVATYVHGLQHRLAGTLVKAVLIKPGPTDTAMTAAQKSEGVRLAPVEPVAKVIVRDIGRGKATIYVPAQWRAIMFVVRSIPSIVFHRLNI